MSNKRFSMRVLAFDDDFNDTPMGMEDDLADYNQMEAEDYRHEGEREEKEVNEDVSYVTVYSVSRHYGGSEEGGWWYDWNEFVKSQPANSPEEAETIKAKLQKEYPYESKELGSVRGQGTYLVMIEEFPRQFETKERPHYE